MVRGKPVIDVYDGGWSGIARRSGFRWSAILWLYRNLRYIPTLSTRKPLSKAVYDRLAGLSVLVLVVFLLLTATAAAILCALVLFWFSSEASPPARLSFVALLGTNIVEGALIWFVWVATYRGIRERLTRREPQKIEARLDARRHERSFRFRRWLYEHEPFIDRLLQFSRLAFPASFWFLIVTTLISGIGKTTGVPRPVLGVTEICILLIPVIAALWRFSALLEDLFGDIELYAVEDTLGRGKSATRALVRDEVESALKRAVLARPFGRAYANIVLIGHSLGSALDYDVLISQADRALAGDTEAPKALRAIRSLIVYGSPIDLFKRYFEVRGSDERHRREAVGEKLFGSGIQIGKATIAVRILNVWAAEDPISNPISEAVAPKVRNVRVRCGIFPFAHIHYTSPSNREFWQSVLPEITGVA